MKEKIQLVIGDKNLSSWSLRAWLVARASAVPFDEILISLDQPETKTKLDQFFEPRVTMNIKI